MSQRNSSRKQKLDERNTLIAQLNVKADEVNSVTQAECIDNLTHNSRETHNAKVEGDGATAQGPKSTAVGKGGVAVGGDVSGSAIVTGNGNTVNIGPQQGGIRAGTIRATNVVDGVQTQGATPADLARLLRDVRTGGISADRIDADHVVSGLQTIDAPAHADKSDLIREIRNVAASCQTILNAGLIPGAGNAEDAASDISALTSECDRPDPDFGRMIRKLQDLAGILASAIESSPAPDDRLIISARQVAALLATVQNRIKT